jgi:LPS sulfotransferase NodH
MGRFRSLQPRKPLADATGDRWRDSFVANVASRLLDVPRARRALRSYAPAAAYRWKAPECRFVVVTAGRTGSELLVSLLDAHPVIRCDSEILADTRSFPDQLIASRAAIAGLRGAKAYGFKLLDTHFMFFQDVGPPGTYLRRLHERGWQIILLERQDLLQQALSHIRAQGTRYHYHRGDGATFTPMVMDPMSVIANMFLLDQHTDFVRAALADVPHLTLVYEQHLAQQHQQQGTVDQVCEYLGLPMATVNSDLVKVAPRTTPEQIANYEDVAAILESTRFAGYLERTPPARIEQT